MLAWSLSLQPLVGLSVVSFAFFQLVHPLRVMTRGNEQIDELDLRRRNAEDIGLEHDVIPRAHLFRKPEKNFNQGQMLAGANDHFIKIRNLMADGNRRPNQDGQVQTQRDDSVCPICKSYPCVCILDSLPIRGSMAYGGYKSLKDSSTLLIDPANDSFGKGNDQGSIKHDSLQKRDKGCHGYKCNATEQPQDGGDELHGCNACGTPYCKCVPTQGKDGGDDVDNENEE
ncbi:hypothetical protein FA10DRAFT_260487 [Acaromyces ingoldii]|uniref:Uncharacterized protein n=1 Tax=Acaromyces ingoldii TaxID=215250 RepID=A0A316YSK0_9BASI|nr:hypothetical protein FA10DRAFT_260487 [Acaromyces ingoldii]PWN90705.1 hypothetical protein FA10DRAFT_260487 [Acaromyces ingoldii]